MLNVQGSSSIGKKETDAVIWRRIAEISAWISFSVLTADLLLD
jgi:hypothetical protein